MGPIRESLPNQSTSGSAQGTTSELQDVTYGQQGFTNLYKMDEDTESQTYGQYVSCLNDVPAEGDTVYYLPTNN